MAELAPFCGIRELFESFFSHEGKNIVLLEYPFIKSRINRLVFIFQVDGREGEFRIRALPIQALSFVICRIGRLK